MQTPIFTKKQQNGVIFMPVKNDAMQDFLTKMFEQTRDIKAVFGPEEHAAVEIFEDAPCYPAEDLVELYRLNEAVYRCPEAERAERIAAFLKSARACEKSPVRRSASSFGRRAGFPR